MACLGLANGCYMTLVAHGGSVDAGATLGFPTVGRKELASSFDRERVASDGSGRQRMVVEETDRLRKRYKGAYRDALHPARFAEQPTNSWDRSHHLDVSYID